MASRRTPRKATEKVSDVIELSSDSEPEAPEVEEVEPEETVPVPDSSDINDQPLLRAAGIKYKTDSLDQEDDEKLSSPNSKLAVRVKDTGSVKHRHVSIEIPLPTSSELRRRKAEAEGTDSQEGNDEIFKTPMERKHITFDDSDNEEFVTPKEGPLENSIARPTKAKAEPEEEEEEEEDSDDEAPEAVSTRAAEAQTLKAAEIAEKAAQRQAAALKRKRQERDTFFKQQAEERKRTQKPASLEEEEDGAGPSTREPTPERAEKKKVPKLLPLELLESDDEDDTHEQANPAANGSHKRRKLGGAEQRLLVDPKLPKDKRLGSTAYRVVAGKGNTKLAPKAKKQAVNMKETLLRRDRVAQPRGGFFVNKR